MGSGLDVGDYVFVKRQPKPGVSERLQTTNFDDVFQVVEKHGEGAEARAYTVADLSGKRSNLGFSQPVSATRLTPVELLPLAQPDADGPTAIIVTHQGRDYRAKVIAQSADGRVYLRYEGEDHDKIEDLSQLSYRWV